MGLKGHRPGCPCVGCSPATRRRGMLALRRNPRPRVTLAQRGTAFVLGKQSPFKGVVRRVNPWAVHAGGTAAAPGKHGFTRATTDGEYHISPISTPYGRHRGYLVHFINTQGKLPGGLWQELGVFRSPNAAKRAAREHAAQHGLAIPNPTTPAARRRFRDVRIGEVFEFGGREKYPFSGFERGPWVKLSARTYRAADPSHRLAGHTLRIGSVLAEIAEVENPATRAGRRNPLGDQARVLVLYARTMRDAADAAREFSRLGVHDARAYHSPEGWVVDVPFSQAPIADGLRWQVLKKVPGLRAENPATPAARRFVSREISHLQRVRGYPPTRAVAASLAVARRAGFRSVGPRPNARPRYWVVSIGSEGAPVVRGPFDFWPDTLAPVRSLRGRGFAAVAVEAPSRAEAIAQARPSLGLRRANPLTRPEGRTALRLARSALRYAKTVPATSPERRGLWAGEARGLAEAYKHFGPGGRGVKPYLRRAKTAARIERQTRTIVFQSNPPRVVGTIPGRMGKIFYNRTGKYRGPYVHKFGRGVQAFRLSDGSVLLRGPRPLWVRQD